MIERIEIVNWRSHKQSELRFKKGTNLLLGIMGAGKSSVLECISYALFGTFPMLERRRVKLENVIRKGEESAKVILDFSFNGSQYRVIRQVGKRKSAEIYKDGQLIERGAVAVSKVVSEVLGVDYELFTRAIYSEQNNIEYFLNLDPRRRKKELDALLGLDRFEEARSSITTVIGRVRAKKEGLENAYEKEREEELRAKKEEYQKALSSLSSSLEELSSLLAELRARWKKAAERHTSLTKKRAVYERLVREVQRLKGVLSSYEEKVRLFSQEELEKVRTAYKEVRKSLEEERAVIAEEERKRRSFLQKIAVMEREVQRARKELEERKRLEKELSTLSYPDLEKLEGEVVKLKNEIYSLKTRIKEAKELMAKVDREAATCPLCGSTISGTAIIEKKGEEIKEAERRMKECYDLLERKEKELKEGRQLKERKTRLQSRLEALKVADVEALERAKEEAKKAMEAVVSAIEERERRVKQLEEQLNALAVELKEKERLAEMVKEYERAKRALEERSALQSQYYVSEEEWGEAEKEKERLFAEVKEKEERLRALKRERAEKERQAAEVGAELERISAIKSKILHLERLEKELNIFKEALLETQVELRASLIEAINKAMNDLWHLFYPYGNYSEVRVRVGENDYVFEVYEKEWKTIESVASGGERAMFALTLRVALAMVLVPKLSWLILDEPTHNLDSNAVRSLADALAFRVPEVVDQVLLITHEEQFMGSDFATTYRLLRDKEKGAATLVEEV